MHGSIQSYAIGVGWFRIKNICWRKEHASFFFNMSQKGDLSPHYRLKMNK